MTTYFVADIHLCSQRPELIQGFVDFIEKTAKDCNSLYLLGDIFEAWIGDDYLDPAIKPVIEALQALSNNGTSLYFQRGNRDFLVGTQFTQLIGAQLLEDSCIVTLESCDALIMHGDQLCTDDIEYQKFRSLVRSPEWQNDFLSKPIAQRLQIAEHLRTQSKEHSSAKSQQITDVNKEQVIQSIASCSSLLLIHGHTHRPAIHSVVLPDKRIAKRMVLGDWGESLWYIKSDASGCKLIEEPIAKNND